MSIIDCESLTDHLNQQALRLKTLCEHPCGSSHTEAWLAQQTLLDSLRKAQPLLPDTPETVLPVTLQSLQDAVQFSRLEIQHYYQTFN